MSIEGKEELQNKGKTSRHIALARTAPCLEGIVEEDLNGGIQQSHSQQATIGAVTQS